MSDTLYSNMVVDSHIGKEFDKRQDSMGTVLGRYVESLLRVKEVKKARTYGSSLPQYSFWRWTKSIANGHQQL